MRPGSASAPERAVPGTPASSGERGPEEQPFRFPSWIVGIAVATLGLGVVGFSGSSSWAESSHDSLLDAGIRARVAELVGRSRSIRSDEFVIETPLIRAQQLARPAFPRVNLDEGLGQMQRGPASVPILDWGLVFRPLEWPLFLGSKHSLGIRWYLRSAVIFLGLFAWFRLLAPRRSARREDALAALCAIAVLFTSAFQWWMSTSMTPTLGFTGLAMAASDRCLTAASRFEGLRWLVVAGWLFACAFFPFYPPLWGPVLWLLCGAIVDLCRRRTHSLRRALVRALPIVLVLGSAVALVIVYAAPYLLLAAGTLYPGRRDLGSGDFPAWRLLDLGWPSFEMLAGFRRPEQYLGAAPSNVCEASAIEVLPVFVLAALAVLEGPARDAVRNVVRRASGLTVATLVLLGWLYLVLPPGLRTALLLRWTPTARDFFVFGFAVALLAGAIILELRPDGLRRVAWRDAAVCAGVLVVTYLALRPAAPARLTGVDALQHYTPMVLFAVLLTVGIGTLGVRAGAFTVALSWALPLVLANFFVNPVVRTRDVLRAGSGHAAITEALRATPGRIVHYSTHDGSYLSGFGWPMLFGVALAPDLTTFDYLSREVPGLTEEVYNRYAHVIAALPPERTRLVGSDAFVIAISPCSERLATLGVNHFLLPTTARFPPECADAFGASSAGELVLFTRRDPVGELGVARTSRASSALEFDFRRSSIPAEARVTRKLDAVEVAVPPDVAALALPVNLSIIGEVRCRGATARAVDAHLVFTATGATPGRCEAAYLSSTSALQGLAAKRHRALVGPAAAELRSLTSIPAVGRESAISR